MNNYGLPPTVEDLNQQMQFLWKCIEAADCQVAQAELTVGMAQDNLREGGDRKRTRELRFNTIQAVERHKWLKYERNAIHRNIRQCQDQLQYALATAFQYGNAIPQFPPFPYAGESSPGVSCWHYPSFASLPATGEPICTTSEPAYNAHSSPDWSACISTRNSESMGYTSSTWSRSSSEDPVSLVYSSEQTIIPLVANGSSRTTASSIVEETISTPLDPSAWTFSPIDDLLGVTKDEHALQDAHFQTCEKAQCSPEKHARRYSEAAIQIIESRPRYQKTIARWKKGHRAGQSMGSFVTPFELDELPWVKPMWDELVWPLSA